VAEQLGSEGYAGKRPYTPGRDHTQKKNTGGLRDWEEDENLF